MKMNQKGDRLVLGWRVTPTLAPKFWLDPEAKPGLQTDEDLVQVPTDAMGCHSAIVAQSGSGKSFFLGRLIEELLLASKARCVILDPNADFRRFSEVVDKALWTRAKYDPKNARGFLPHEPTRADFATPWSNVQIRLLTGPQFFEDDKHAEQFLLQWPSLSVEFLAEDLDPMMRSAVYHCHQFIRVIDRLYRYQHAINEGTQRRRDKSTTDRRPSRFNLIEEARRILRQISPANMEDRKNILDNEFHVEPRRKLNPKRKEAGLNVFLFDPVGRLRHQRAREINQAVAAVDYISDEASRYYFGKAHEFIAQGIVETRISDGEPARESTRPRVQVIDLPSFPDWKTRLLALNSALATEWNQARSRWEQAISNPGGEDARVPTFIIVDEAHNVIPSMPRGLAAEALREQFRTIAAEGRKYGLFLIICTQRPDKIDPLVLSECENQAIMKLGSRSVLDITKALFGLEDIPTNVLLKSLEFETGRALLIGRWVQNGPEILYTAMRRTVEGGKNLSADYWATPDRPANGDSGIGSENTRSKGHGRAQRLKVPAAKRGR